MGLHTREGKDIDFAHHILYYCVKGKPSQGDSISMTFGTPNHQGTIVRQMASKIYRIPLG